MASLRDALLPAINSIRGIPGQLGIRNYRVAILIGTWSGSNTGRGSSIGELFPVTEGGGQPPKVRELNTEELALGSLGKGSIRIGPITPDFAGGGTPISQLRPAVVAGQTVHVRVTGPGYPNGALFLIKDISTDRALHWTMVASPVSELAP